MPLKVDLYPFEYYRSGNAYVNYLNRLKSSGPLNTLMAAYYMFFFVVFFFVVVFFSWSVSAHEWTYIGLILDL